MLTTFSGMMIFWTCFSYLEERLFCSLKDDEITLYFNATEDSKKCSSYLQNVESKMNDTYEELEDIFRHIQSKQDLPYRTKLFKNKQQIFLMLGNVKKQILDKMEQFEKTIFLRYKAYLSEDLLHKKRSLQYQINVLSRKMQNLTWSTQEGEIGEEIKEEKNLEGEEKKLDPESELAFLLFQKDQIEKIQNATSLQELVESVQQYFNWQKTNDEDLNS